MKISDQDEYYRNKEGDDFFRRNFRGKELPELRPAKKVIAENLRASGIKFQSVLEYGCNYGDLLHFLRKEGLAEECRGVEASEEAVAFGRERYGSEIVLERGTIADNAVNDSEAFANHFDLAIIDDVFGWVSRQTILSSVANIDNMVADGGYVFIRDFWPDKRVKNRNHHVKDGDVFNFKVPGSHAQLFLATGMYEIHWQKVYFDDIGMSTGYKSDNPFNYRWTDIILKKSYQGFFWESKAL
jgi:SAM-dependent methyltransferase